LQRSLHTAGVEINRLSTGVKMRRPRRGKANDHESLSKQGENDFNALG
jgi:hypothetical protein